jgi:hypothetical protein
MWLCSKALQSSHTCIYRRYRNKTSYPTKTDTAPHSRRELLVILSKCPPALPVGRAVVLAFPSEGCVPVDAVGPGVDVFCAVVVVTSVEEPVPLLVPGCPDQMVCMVKGQFMEVSKLLRMEFSSSASMDKYCPLPNLSPPAVTTIGSW